MKKRVIRIFSGLVMMSALILPSCEFLEDCGTCQTITEDSSGNIVSEGTPLLYCGDEYQEKLNSSPTTIGGTTTYWYCY